jgi:hypothetical protein
MAKDQNKISAYPMEQLAPVIMEFLGEGKQVIITGRGNSMLPLIRNGKDHIKLAPCKAEELEPGDVIFYRRSGGSYVIHRVIERSSDNTFTIKGDSQTWAERGIVKEQIYGRMVAYIRGDKEVSVDNRIYRIYARFWTRSKIIRAFYEFLLKASLKIKAKILK